MERGIHVLGHARGVAADVEVGAGLEPGVEFGCVLQHAVLDVDLFRLVAGEGEVEAGEHAGGLERGEFLAVEEIGGGLLVAEEEPVAALCAGGAALLEKGTERRNAGAGPDHDHGDVAAGGRAEGLVRMDEHTDRARGEAALGEEGGTDALAGATVLVVADGADGEVDLPGMGLGRGGDGVEARLELLQAGDEVGRCGLRGGREEDVDDVVKTCSRAR